jgi:hypothetical protein
MKEVKILNIKEKLLQIQTKLKAPKSQYNGFGHYAYRSCEDVLEALKPLLLETNVLLTISDEIRFINDRYYIEATALLTDMETPDSIITTAYAREEEIKKGMDSSQITGSVSSYARKYALNGLFLIDDNKDADETPPELIIEPTDKTNDSIKPDKEEKGVLTAAQLKRIYSIANVAGYKQEDVKYHISEKYGVKSTELLTKKQYNEMCTGYEKLANKGVE